MTTAIRIETNGGSSSALEANGAQPDEGQFDRDLLHAWDDRFDAWLGALTAAELAALDASEVGDTPPESKTFRQKMITREISIRAELERKAKRLADRAALAAAVGVALDRWMPFSAETNRCECPVCREARTHLIQCPCCGYHGEPFLNACLCEYERLSSISSLRRSLQGDSPFEALTAAQRERAQHDLQELEAMAPLGPCADPKASDCSHGSAECPVCINDRGQGGNWGDDRNNAHPWEIIRDVRAALTSSEDPAMTASRSIDAHILFDGEFYQLDIEAGSDLVGDDGEIGTAIGVAVASPAAVRALGYALLRAAAVAPKRIRGDLDC